MKHEVSSVNLEDVIYGEHKTNEYVLQTWQALNNLSWKEWRKESSRHNSMELLEGKIKGKITQGRSRKVAGQDPSRDMTEHW